VARPERLAQLELLQLAGGGAGQRGDELDPLGALEAGQCLAAVRLMYSISGRDSRKFTGTSTRPQPDTPKHEVSSLAEFCETIATRPPAGTPSWSSRAACARARAAISR